MNDGRHDELLDILQRCYKPREDGWLWMAMYQDDQEGGVVSEIEGDYEDPVATADSLTAILNDVRPDRCYFALCRRGGRPRESDRWLWRRLREQISTDSLVDFVVFDDEAAWSMRAEDAEAAATG